MYMCVCTYTSIYIYYENANDMCTHAYVCIYTNRLVYTCTCICSNESKQMCMCRYIHMDTHIAYAYVYIYIYVCMYVCKYTCT